MSGHSKWATTKHHKALVDAKRGNLFTKLAKEITVAAKLGDANPDMNPRLRLAISAARKESMPNDNIKRAIARAMPDSGEGDYDELRYEGYAPGGAAVIVECLTDNKNRTAAELRSIFSKNGGSLGEAGSVAFNFNHVGMFAYASSAAAFDDIFETGCSAGAIDVEEDDGNYIITCGIPQFGALMKALEKYGEPESAKIVWTPKTPMELDDEAAEKLENFIGLLEENDDVQDVYHN
ncbi:MAG: YebC/PmpR family DNA-binding transcriptional regulator [Rickettsiales bacterium]|jgi:YebC/PmpR family DNA-binding regulatory protein|nr:YebC/PmpR family DNA-binding transcriptional regulator [Rickettsiales bacterium]